MTNIPVIFNDLSFLNKEHEAMFNSSYSKIFKVSPFILDKVTHHPEFLNILINHGYLFEVNSTYRYKSEICALLSCINNDVDLYKSLRLYRNREMVRIAWRDIAGWAEIEDTMLELTFLAEAFICETLDYLFANFSAERGCPLTDSGDIQRLVVLGMGKLGAWELNFSSDIDLIFFYEQDGNLGGKKSTSYFEFYTKLVQSFIKTLDTVTEHGFVFRIDTRLRPFGESGPLVMNYDGLENYYQGQAREWERYAMVKARVISGDTDSSERLQEILSHFTYRRYLDYRAIGELRQLKKKINYELQSKDKTNNIKLGFGGIREIEFIGQVFQLIRGGQDKTLRERRILSVLNIIAELHFLPVEVILKLKDAYRFLRLVENRLQQYGDKQTHDLPSSDMQKGILAYGLGYSDYPSFLEKLDFLRIFVHSIFDQVFESKNPTSDEFIEAEWLDMDISILKQKLISLGYNAPESIIKLIVEFRQSYSIRQLSVRGNNELNHLITIITNSIVHYENPDIIIGRLFDLFKSISGRNVYFTLLKENPLALTQLIKLSSKSSWIIRLISSYPLLLDELLDSRILCSELTIQSLKLELDYYMNQINPNDLDELLGALCHFKNANMLRIASADLSGIISINTVSYYLSILAETIINCVLYHAWCCISIRHGTPPNTPPDKIKGFGIITYGKLGGLELSYASDLDLVFLYGGVNDTTLTTGEKPIPCAQFFAKVVKRMVVILTTHVHSGTLYEIDLRLRPSGNSGLLVSSLEAYKTYQMENSWTWEQQALVRARFIAGDPIIGEQFHNIRQLSLCRKRDLKVLQSEVLDMRRKMRVNLEIENPGYFDLKQAIGCIADIEFIVQFAVLAHSSEHNELTQWTDVLRLLRCLQAINFFSLAETEQLNDAYCQFREQSHRAALLQQSATVPDDQFVAIRAMVSSIWHDKIGAT